MKVHKKTFYDPRNGVKVKVEVPDNVTRPPLHLLGALSPRESLMEKKRLQKLQKQEEEEAKRKIQRKPRRRRKGNRGNERHTLLREYS